jgi:hypothetical protein
MACQKTRGKLADVYYKNTTRIADLLQLTTYYRKWTVPTQAEIYYILQADLCSKAIFVVTLGTNIIVVLYCSLGLLQATTKRLMATRNSETCSNCSGQPLH